MVQRRNYQAKQPRRRNAAPPPIAQPAKELYEPKAKVTYGKPIILLEDSQKNVFIYRGGQWVSYERTISECRVDCQVNALSQKINGRTRYEVSFPVE
ncbi:MAG TPA: hypothetical protein VFE24_05715 [Pirellulales bacterium]|jgi:hypothetical protein|nr:hypothetical protein [Pirellulales bacterium]